MSDNSQLFKKENNGYKEVYPLSYIQNIIDAETKEKLSDILIRYNHIYVPWQDNVTDTRLSVPKLIRRKGLWISYDKEGTLYTEYFKLSTLDAMIDSYWESDDNWETVPNLEFVRNEASKLPDGIVTPEKLSPALQELIKQNNNITNLPDDEDLEEKCGVIKFKDRDYNPYISSGKGYKILRKNWVRGYNTLTQNMINKENTIYEIRYDYDLNGETIKIPENVILDFQGGSLSNGVIVGDNVLIKGDNTKLFYNISFEGKICETNIAHLEWFVKNYSLSYNDSSEDSSEELSAAFNSGLVYWTINEPRYYKVDNTIEINKSVYIKNICPRPIGVSANRLREDIIEPCFYSTTVATLIHYKHVGVNGEFTTNTVSIDGITLYVNKEFDSITDETINTPILLIDSLGKRPLDKIYINANIHSTGKFIRPAWANADVTGYNFTGIEIRSINQGVNFVYIYGHIFRVFRAYNFVLQNPDLWFTESSIHAETQCIIGTDTKYGYPMKIFGNHNPMPYYAASNGKHYFDCSAGNAAFYGTMWDLSKVQPSGISNVDYGIICKNAYGTTMVNQWTKDDLDQRGILLNNKYSVPNIWYNSIIGRNNYDSLLYFDLVQSKLDDTTFSILINNETLVDIQYLIEGNQLAQNTQSIAPTIYGKYAKLNSTLFTKGEKHIIQIVYSKGINTEIEAYLRENNILLTLYNISYATKSNLKIYSLNGELLETFDFTRNGTYNLSDLTYLTKVQYSKLSKIVYEYEITIPTSDSNEYILIPTNYAFIKNFRNEGNNIMFMETIDAFKTSTNGIRQSIGVLSPTLKQPIYLIYGDGIWRFADGCPITTKYFGTTSERPIGIKIGFKYFDTTLGKPIFWNGSSWVDALGGVIS